MPRPIISAVCAVMAVGFGATWFGIRLSDRVQSSVASTPAPTSAAPLPMPSNAGRILTVNADFGGHFIVHPTIEGRRVRMLVDTGATLVALTQEDAIQAGVRPDATRTKRMSTANGVIEVQSARIAELRLGDILVRDVEAVVMPRGRLATSLLGMSFLRGLRGFEIGQGRLLLKG